MPTIPQLVYIMKSPNQQSISENSEVEIWSLGIDFLQAASAWLSVTSLNHETVTGVRVLKNQPKSISPEARNFVDFLIFEAKILDFINNLEEIQKINEIPCLPFFVLHL